MSESDGCPYTSFYKQIIEAFSFEGQTVLSAMTGKGESCILAIWLVFPKFGEFVPNHAWIITHMFPKFRWCKLPHLNLGNMCVIISILYHT